MASGLLGMQVPGNRLRVRVPCPPLSHIARQAITRGDVFLRMLTIGSAP